MAATAFQKLFEDKLEPLISAPENFPEIIDILEQNFASMPTADDRAEVYHWLAVANNVMGAKELSARDIDAAREHFSLTEEYFVKALEQNERRLNTRISLARHYLSPMGAPELAFGLLEPIDDPERDHEEQLLTFFEHERHVLRGVVLAMLSSTDEAIEEFEVAYGPKFRGRLPSGPDITALHYLISNDIRFSPEDFGRILLLLRLMHVDEKKLNDLSFRLIG